MASVTISDSSVNSTWVSLPNTADTWQYTPIYHSPNIVFEPDSVEMKHYRELMETNPWLGEGNNPAKIEGFPTDFERLADYIEGALKKQFPINQVPSEMAEQFEDTRSALVAAKEAVRLLIEEVTTHFLMIQRVEKS